MARARWRSTLPLGATLRESARITTPAVGCVENRAKPDCAAVCAPDTAWAGFVCLVGSLYLQVLSLCDHDREAPSSATLGTQPREPARGRSSHIRRIMGGAIKCTVLVPLIPIVVWCRIMVANETEENASETETENPVQASEIRKPECLNSLIRQLVQGIFCDAG